MEKYFPYDTSNPQSVVGETHTIKNGQVRLRHIPQENSIQIAGFTQADSPAALQFNEFYCWYASDTLYRDSNRLVYFSNLRNGSTVNVTYSAIGTVVIADDMNEIKAHMENTDTQFVNVNFALNQQSNEILNLRNQIAGLDTLGGGNVDVHDADHNAHQFIQGLIQTEESARIIADNNLQTSIQAEQSARAAADSNLQSSISAETSARTSADNNLQTQINGKMTFAGTSTAFPQNPAAGWLAIVNDAPYLFDGSQWALLKSASDNQFVLGSESSTLEGAMWISLS